MSIIFDESLVTGNNMIDTQHKELIDRVNKLVASCETNKEKNVAIQTLDFLMDYTVFHFDAEEKLQKETDYPDYDSHKKQHEEFAKAVEDLKDMLQEEEGPTDAFVAAVKRNVSDWLVNHIQGYDKKVADYVKSL
ncbi:hemerythrin [Lactonifactor longoviformis]|uniref:Hemerythrin n=1 Tax=Lactonifactor longoviformis DSM 17459 TaxID=1122155 RepID=A0A1M4WF64_9CLOT|nr:bacteriohemerythrin [Lactonifactor longoviformis]POP32663.1 hemerythrin [Lactonifactor longoviformis]SHE79835.1 hemerythrin [Lactonifactor longoviformis DSM 17459]